MKEEEMLIMPSLRGRRFSGLCPTGHIKNTSTTPAAPVTRVRKRNLSRSRADDIGSRGAVCRGRSSPERYGGCVELDGRKSVPRLLEITKMRKVKHSREIRTYGVTENGTGIHS